MDVTAAILAGGLGTRLRSVVADRPKPLVHVGDRAFITRLLDQLADIAISEAILLTGYRARQVRRARGKSHAGMRLTYAEEPFPLGTAGALRRALPQLSGQSVLLLNGDSYCAVHLKRFYQWHCRQTAGASLVVARVSDISRFGQVQRDGGGRVISFQEKGQARGAGWINAGIYLIERSLVASLPATSPLSLECDVLPGWVERRLVWGMEYCGPFLDIGTPDSYAEADAFFGREKLVERSSPRC